YARVLPVSPLRPFAHGAALVAGGAHGSDDGRGASNEGVTHASPRSLGCAFRGSNPLGSESWTPLRRPPAGHRHVLRRHFSIPADEQGNVRAIFVQREFGFRDVVRFVAGSARVAGSAYGPGRMARSVGGADSITGEILARTFRWGYCATPGARIPVARHPESDGRW